MTNMAAEIGGFTGIVAPDKKAVEFLVERRGMNRQARGRNRSQGRASGPRTTQHHNPQMSPESGDDGSA